MVSWSLDNGKETGQREKVNGYNRDCTGRIIPKVNIYSVRDHVSSICCLLKLFHLLYLIVCPVSLFYSILSMYVRMYSHTDSLKKAQALFVSSPSTSVTLFRPNDFSYLIRLWFSVSFEKEIWNMYSLVHSPYNIIPPRFQ